jgi:hypothetical protein
MLEAVCPSMYVYVYECVYMCVICVCAHACMCVLMDLCVQMNPCLLQTFFLTLLMGISSVTCLFML